MVRSHDQKIDGLRQAARGSWLRKDVDEIVKRGAADAFAVRNVGADDDNLWSNLYCAIQDTLPCTTNDGKSWPRVPRNMLVATV